MSTLGWAVQAQDELGTPFSVTVALSSVEDLAVPTRQRDSTPQERVKVDELADRLRELV